MQKCLFTSGYLILRDSEPYSHGLKQLAFRTLGVSSIGHRPIVFQPYRKLPTVCPRRKRPANKQDPRGALSRRRNEQLAQVYLREKPTVQHISVYLLYTCVGWHSFIHSFNQYTPCLKKRPTFTTCYNFYMHSSIATIFGTMMPRMYAIKMYFIFPPRLTSASALPGKTHNPQIASFHLNAACFFTKNTKHS